MKTESTNNLIFHIDGRDHEIDPAAGVSLAIPLDFLGAQPNAYGVPAAASTPCEAAGGIVGDTRRGGSCNFEEYRFIPHCNGTHTECVGHITHARIAVNDCLRDAFVPAVVVSVRPVAWYVDGADAYGSASDPSDVRITRHVIETALAEYEIPPDAALVVRTLPNDESKRSRRYVDEIPPYFTADAMELIVRCGFRHLVVDMPSIDRLFDDGKLSNHRIFWGVEPDSFEVGESTRLHSTITELAFVPANVRDGIYLLSIQIPPFMSDAAPSRPLLFRL